MGRTNHLALVVASTAIIAMAACTVPPRRSSPAGAPAQSAPVPDSRREMISPSAEQLFQVIDNMDVEHYWPAGRHISWESGVPDGKPEWKPGNHTHCSAFAAAAAKRVGVYLLRPPQHSEYLLANAQYDWLLAQGPASGWQRVGDEVAAQRLANEGQLVLASYHNHDNDKPGHIAIVRPSNKDLAMIHEEGPQITQAGAVNHRSVPLRQGFSSRRRFEVAYYAHTVDAATLK